MPNTPSESSSGYFRLFPMLLFLFSSLIILSPAELRRVQSPVTCDEQCGGLRIPFPFYLNASCGAVSAAFRLSCANSTAILRAGAGSYRVLGFSGDGVLVDFPGASSCRHYSDLNAFGSLEKSSFGISVENVVGLYDCDDSSLCKASCEKIELVGCDSPACCYPLNDRSVWGEGDDFGVFLKYGCRGFSSWVVERGWNKGKRGVKLEWGIPRNLSEGVCAENGYVVNATAVEGAVRCECAAGYVGDGFARGLGCLKSCIKDGMNAYGSDCRIKRHNEKELLIFTGVLAPLFIVASLVCLFCILKRPTKPTALDSGGGRDSSHMMLHKPCRTRLFTYRELEEATAGFRDDVVNGRNGAIFEGILGDGLRVAVQKLEQVTEGDVLSHIDILNALAHKNVARILGCCIHSAGCAPMLIYEHPSNGTLEKHLGHQKGNQVTLDWGRRLKIAAETAGAVAFLRFELSPPILHRCLDSGHIFLDADFSAKVSGFSVAELGASCWPGTDHTDVYNFGMVLLEMVTGMKIKSELPVVAAALQKIRSGKLEEIVDPGLNYHEQARRRREEMEIVADLGARCLLYGGDGKLKMDDVSKELVNIVKLEEGSGSEESSGIEETFSNSSLLQMISMSPDSIQI